MKPFLFIIGALLAVSANAAGLTSRINDVQAVEKAEHTWMAAMQHRDEGTLNRIVAPDFALAGIDDLDRPAVPREAWMDNALHHLKVDRVSFQKLTVSVFGDVAIARSAFRWSGAFDSETFDDTSVLVDTWIRHGSRWVVVSRIVGEMPAASTPKN